MHSHHFWTGCMLVWWFDAETHSSFDYFTYRAYPWSVCTWHLWGMFSIADVDLLRNGICFRPVVIPTNSWRLCLSKLPFDQVQGAMGLMQAWRFSSGMTVCRTVDPSRSCVQAFVRATVITPCSNTATYLWNWVLWLTDTPFLWGRFFAHDATRAMPSMVPPLSELRRGGSEKTVVHEQ